MTSEIFSGGLPQPLQAFIPHLDTGSILSIRRVSKNWLKSANEILMILWTELKKNEGLVKLSAEINILESTHGEKPFHLFKELASTLIKTEVVLQRKRTSNMNKHMSIPSHIPEQMPPELERELAKPVVLYISARPSKPPLEYNVLDSFTRAQSSLLRIWPRILERIPPGKAPELSTVKGIREWLAIPENIALFQGSILDLSNLGLRTIPIEIIAKFPIKILYLTNNKITQIPDQISTLKALELLDLSNNQISAPLDAIGALTNLETLHLSNNKLCGLPETIKSLINLKDLNLSNNNLEILPDIFQFMSKLTRLNLSSNKLSMLPATIGDLNNLGSLTLAQNEFSTFPDVIADLPKLKHLLVEKNPLIYASDKVLLSESRAIQENPSIKDLQMQLGTAPSKGCTIA